jgi:hypothetical protein
MQFLPRRRRELVVDELPPILHEALADFFASILVSADG